MTSLPPIPIHLVTAQQIETLAPEVRAWATATGFQAQADSFCLVPGEGGHLRQVLVGYEGTVTPWVLGAVSAQLPNHHYRLAGNWTPEEATALSLGWRLGQYQFSTYRENDRPLATLMNCDHSHLAYLEAASQATQLVRDLINTPANDMGPEQLEAEIRQLAQTHDAQLSTVTGPDLLAQNYPMIYAVGQASAQAPRLLDLRWGNLSHPRVTLVGKGVCFDSGGLDLKPAQGMLMMKKDMGGAAHVLGVAKMVMALNLPVALRVLIPAVENSVAGNAMRPLDVLKSRRGLSVEVGNTDAEGRLVLADALWEAVSEDLDLLIDFATLTGAARVALGSELPACFCNQPDLARQVLACGEQTHDPLWQLPLHQPYRSLLESKVADLSNISSGSYGGAITAALFLQEFIKPETPWIHIDVMAWNVRSLPGRPEGGEAMGMRAIVKLIEQIARDESGLS
ncbi:leucyl aminopeptidase family protein [Lyngbya confervoides]|uniref:Probable cytosol aminopeptidase n=1 Tax=Lyngbya confervoides BDU141951 TaxID=1574623 RepID=A0ABD4T3B2_9CYAN|nr:leucyl aminopeptidase family protein [Lyngbya confervoides]MCM1983116.1 leucyl aminopeptidase family protein [Lyngbya confervoides BDU141951]